MSHHLYKKGKPTRQKTKKKKQQKKNESHFHPFTLLFSDLCVCVCVCVCVRACVCVCESLCCLALSLCGELPARNELVFRNQSWQRTERTKRQGKQHGCRRGIIKPRFLAQHASTGFKDHRATDHEDDRATNHAFKGQVVSGRATQVSGALERVCRHTQQPKDCWRSHKACALQRWCTCVCVCVCARSVCVYDNGCVLWFITKLNLGAFVRPIPFPLVYLHGLDLFSLFLLRSFLLQVDKFKSNYVVVILLLAAYAMYVFFEGVMCLKWMSLHKGTDLIL